VLASSFEVEILQPESPSEARLGSAEGEKTSPRVLLLPLPMSEPAGIVCLKYAYVFRGRWGLNILTPDYKVVFSFLLFRVFGLVW
jgi:hypothetical protein